MTTTTHYLHKDDILVNDEGRLAMLKSRKDDNSGWWCYGGGGLADWVITGNDWRLLTRHAGTPSMDIRPHPSSENVTPHRDNQTMTFTDPNIAPTIKRDQWGRYQIKHPTEGKVRSWTRVTTFADAVTTKHALHGWDETNIAWGIAQRPDLVALASVCGGPDDNGLRDVIEQAKAVSEEAAARNKGSAIHGWTERIDQEDIGLVDIPIDWVRDDVRAYLDTLEAAGITILEDDTGQWIERVVLLPQLDDGPSAAGVAGTFDRIVTHPDWPSPRIMDLKTGQNIMRFGMTKIPLQLACYAHATHWWNPKTDELAPMPKVDLERAVVAWIPAGSGHCELYNVNIARGWQMVDIAKRLRDWQRLDGGDLVEQITPIRGGPTLTPVPDNGETRQSQADTDFAWHHNLEARIAWITARCRGIQAASAPRDPDSPIRQLQRLVPSDWPTPYFPPKGPGPQSHEDVDAIAAMCTQIEDGTDMPFSSPDPGAPKQTKASTTKRK